MISVYVCLCVLVCPRSYLRNCTSDIHQFFAHVPYGRGSVLLWRRSDTLCTSGLWMTSYLFISQGCSTSRSIGLGYKLRAVIPVGGQRTHGTTFRALKITSQAATSGVESAVYDCLVCLTLLCLDSQSDVWDGSALVCRSAQQRRRRRSRTRRL